MPILGQICSLRLLPFEMGSVVGYTNTCVPSKSASPVFKNFFHPHNGPVVSSTFKFIPDYMVLNSRRLDYGRIKVVRIGHSGGFW
jgi:hypothetical protein